ncbi:hypothetical protein [Hymenobacter wooponensis]|uniref:Uncharacterized protein n=1 Tax=Hymenobacter wooponensis TaxID=1525360 RepID=A0A4Z0MJN8_9BACT|nr:hypothetical protein [Hymenobacter wooponensis]TGD79731.1 hypothetical protein EU557_16070 [Hymenobacter wooponensis]
MAAALLLYSGVFHLAMVALINAAFCFSMRKGIELDLGSRQYRLFTSLFGFRAGDWEKLPLVQHITMKYFSDLVTSGKECRIRTDQHKRYIVMFSVSGSSQGVILQDTLSYDTASSLTKFLAESLNVEAKLYDSV